MNLGENIYRLRTERNMSQGALADALEVSRQSVSKWENNSATPELDKLIKMSELFGISLDELVGKEIPVSPAPESVIHGRAASPQSERSSLAARQIAGIIFLCFGFLAFLVLSILGGIGTGLLYSAPFWILAAICLICKTRVLLKCGWALLILVSEYLSFATGSSRRSIFVYLFTDISNYLEYPYGVYAIISLVINLLLMALILWTVRSYNKNHKPMTGRGKRFLIIGWILFCVLCVITTLMQPPDIEYTIALIRILSLILNLVDWLKVAAFTVLLTFTLRLLPKRKENP